MHKAELDPVERDSFDRAMDTIKDLGLEDQWAILEHAVASSIGYASRRDDEALRQWAMELLATVRANSSKAYRAAVEDSRPPHRPVRGISVSSMLAGIAVDG